MSAPPSPSSLQSVQLAPPSPKQQRNNSSNHRPSSPTSRRRVQKWMTLSRLTFVFGIIAVGMLQSQQSAHHKVLQHAIWRKELEDKVNSISSRRQSSSRSRLLSVNSKASRPNNRNKTRHHNQPKIHLRRNDTRAPESDLRRQQFIESQFKTNDKFPVNYTVSERISQRGSLSSSTRIRTNNGSVHFSNATVPMANTSTTPSSSSLSSSSLYHVDELCGGCRYQQHQKVQCGKRLEEIASERNLSLVDAGKQALERKLIPVGCRSCLECEDHHRQYWLPDQAAPTVHRAATHYLKTIPEEDYRVPRSVLATQGHEDITRFFEQEPNRYPAKRYLFEYNPSIVPMPLNDNLNMDGAIPAYVASYRVATQQSCFPTNTTREMIGGSWENRPRSFSYLAIGLLDKDLTLLADVVVDLPRRFGLREDFRLFVLHKQLYLSSYSKLTPLYLGNENNPPYSNETETQSVENVFPSALKLRVGRQHLFVSNDNGVAKNGKNLNFFEDPETHQIMVELNPAGDLISQTSHRQVQPVDLTPPPLDANHSHQIYGKDNVTKELPDSGRPSFYTVDELALAKYHNLYESPYVSDRGSACCVPFERNQQNLLLGVSHVKIPWGRRKTKEAGLVPNQYFSRFYASEPTAPYRTVAMSGYFCLNSFVDQAGDNPLAERPSHAWFTIGDLTMNCPTIHFVTGMTVKVDDPSKLIIAYGHQDCTSWFVEVSKEEVVGMLFGTPASKGLAARIATK